MRLQDRSSVIFGGSTKMLQAEGQILSEFANLLRPPTVIRCRGQRLSPRQTALNLLKCTLGCGLDLKTLPSGNRICGGVPGKTARSASAPTRSRFICSVSLKPDQIGRAH